MSEIDLTSLVVMTTLGGRRSYYPHFILVETETQSQLAPGHTDHQWLRIETKQSQSRFHILPSEIPALFFGIPPLFIHFFGTVKVHGLPELHWKTQCPPRRRILRPSMEAILSP